MAVFQEDKKKPEGSTLGLSSTYTPATSVNSPSLTPEQKQGSGRFTNLQQYLNANKGAGQKLATGIGSKIEKDVEPAKKDSQEYTSKVAEGIQSARQNLQTGAQGVTQLQGINQNIQAQTGADKYGQEADLGIQSFKENPNYQQFKNIQGGQGVNENALNAYQTSLNQAVQQYGNLTNQALQDLSTEGGRFTQLQKTFGGMGNPNYSRGQQRLDQLFLKQDGIGDLKRKIGTENQAASQLAKTTAQSAGDVSNVIGSEQSLINDINTQAGQAEQNYIKMLESYIPKVNEIRGQEWDSLDSALKNKGTTLTADQIAKLGVTAPRRAYNVFDSIQGVDVATRGQDASTYGDVAKQRDVDLYNILGDIANIGDDQRRLTEASKLGDAYTARTDDGSLTNRLNLAAQNYEQKLDNKVHDPRLVNVSDSSFRDLLEKNNTITSRQAIGYTPNVPQWQEDAIRNFINEQGAANVIDPNAGVRNVLAGQNIGKGTFSNSVAGEATNYGNYNPIIDDALRAALDQIIKQNTF